MAGFLRDRAKALNIVVWARNLFVPMFGESDAASRMISFFVRFSMIIFRTIVWLFMAVLAVVVAVGWLVLPPLVIYLLIGQIR